MEKHQRSIIVNEKVLRKYLVLSPTVIQVMERDRLFPESFVSRLKNLRPLEQNAFMLDYVINFPGVEAYENFVFLLRKTSQSWLSEIIESGKSVDSHMRFRPDELMQSGNYMVNPGGVAPLNTGFDPLFGQISGDIGCMNPNELLMETGQYAADGYPMNGGNSARMAKGSLMASGIIDMVRECRQRQIDAEQHLVHLQREQLALKHRISENQKEQMTVRSEQVSLQQLATNADRVTRMARQTEVASSLARASMGPAALPVPGSPKPYPRAAIPALPGPSAYTYRAVPTRLGYIRGGKVTRDPPVPMTSNLNLRELTTVGRWK